MNVPDAIRRAVPIIANGHADPAILRAWLLRAGLTHAQAHDAVRFIPLALGREVLAGSGVDLKRTYVRVGPSDTRGEERSLDDEPFFKETTTLASTLGAELGSETIIRVAMLSSEFQAINAALNAGSQMEDLVTSPPVVECEINTSNTPAKPWWRFWS